MSSAGGLIVEIVAGRLVAPYVGMSLYTWTAIIAVVLAGLSAGHWIGGRLAGPEVQRKLGLRRLAIALGLAAVSTLLVLLILNDLAIGLLSSGLGSVSVVLVLTVSLFLLPSLFVGVVAPIVTKLAVDEAPGRVGSVLGRMFALGTVGSIAGTLLAGFVFVSWVGSSGTLIAVAVVYALLALICAVLTGRPAGVVMAVALVSVGGLLGTVGGARGAFDSRCTVESDYFCILIDDFAPVVGRPSALMVLDNLVHSINDRDDPSLLYSPYIQFVDEFARRRFPLHRHKTGFAAFFVGGGGYTLPRSWAATVDGARLMVAEIDPAVTNVAADRMWLETSHPALEIRHLDARVLLQSLPREPQFDVILGDAFHDISVPTHLVTREFHGEIAARLHPRGLYAVNVVDAARNPTFLASIVFTLDHDFSVVEIWRETEDTVSPDGRVTYVVVASDTWATESVLEASFGIPRIWQRVEIGDLMDAGTEAPVLLTDDYAPVDRLLSSVLLSRDP